MLALSFLWGLGALAVHWAWGCRGCGIWKFGNLEIWKCGSCRGAGLACSVGYVLHHAAQCVRSHVEGGRCLGGGMDVGQARFVWQNQAAVQGGPLPSLRGWMVPGLLPDSGTQTVPGLHQGLLLWGWQLG